MKIRTLSILTAACFLLAGCGKQGSSSELAVPVAEPAMMAWEQGDKPTAVSRFLEADWSGRPLFPRSSLLSLTEDQFAALPRSEIQAKSSQILSQVDELERLASAVAQAGEDSAAKGDTGQARKYFTSLQQCGAAFDSTNCLKMVQILGRSFEEHARTELAKIGQ